MHFFWESVHFPGGCLRQWNNEIFGKLYQNFLRQTCTKRLYNRLIKFTVEQSSCVPLFRMVYVQIRELHLLYHFKQYIWSYKFFCFRFLSYTVYTCLHLVADYYGGREKMIDTLTNCKLTRHPQTLLCSRWKPPAVFTRYTVYFQVCTDMLCITVDFGDVKTAPIECKQKCNVIWLSSL